MHNWSYHLSPTPFIFCLYHVDIGAPMIRQRVGVEIRRDCLKRDHFLVDQILSLMLEVDAVFSIMSNTVGIISTSLLRSVESGVDIHGLGPHRADVSGCRQSFEQLGSAFSQHGEASGGLLLKPGARGIIPALLRGRDLLVIAGIWAWSLGSGVGLCLVVWHWSLVIWMGALIC